MMSRTRGTAIAVPAFRRDDPNLPIFLALSAVIAA